MPATNLPPDALAAALAAAAKTPPPGMAGGGGGGGAAPPSASPQGSPDQADPNAQPGQADPNAPDPTTQAVWDTFPSTDPQSVESMMGQMQGAAPDQLVQMLGSFMQQADSDQQKLSQMQEALIAHMMELLGAPGGSPMSSGPGAPPIPSAGPGVSGAQGGGTPY